MLRSVSLWKLYGGYFVLIIVITASIGVIISQRVQRDSLQRVRAQLEAEAYLLRSLVGDMHELDADGQPSASALDRRIREIDREIGARLTILAEDGRVIADSREDAASMDNHQHRPEVRDARELGYGFAQRYSATQDVDMLYVALPLARDGEPMGYVRTALPLPVVEEQISGTYIIAFLGAVLVGMISLVLGYYLVRQVSRPLSARTAEAESQSAVDRSRLAAILSSMSEGVIAVDEDATVVHLNATAGAILGVTPNDTVGKPVWKVVRAPGIADTLNRTLSERRRLDAEVRLGEGPAPQVLQIQSAPLLEEAGTVSGAVLVLHDISRVRSLEGVRRDFVANVSHELKTPLAAVRGYIDTILDDPDMDDSTRERFLERVQQQTARLGSLVIDLLALARFDSEDPGFSQDELDLRAPIRESVRPLLPEAELKSLELDLDLPDEPVMVCGDAEALRQVFDNLLSNALKYTPEGGRVIVHTRVQGSQIITEVRDTGVGMASEHLSRIFERFYRVDRARSRELGGTGLGLSIVKHIVTRLGGSINVQSKVGEGTVFFVQLPAVPSPAAFGTQRS